jgi:low temperature requirement protein LtrA
MAWRLTQSPVRRGKSMTTKVPLRRPETPAQATFVELFFDLAFVFALLQLSHNLTQHLYWSSAFQTLVLLLALWRVWLVTIWITDRLDPEALDPKRLVLQLLVMVTLLGSLILALALPQAFGKDGLIFASVYAGIQSGRYLFLLFLLRGTEIQRVVVRSLWLSGVSVPSWIAGAFTHGIARSALWAFAIAVEYAIFALNVPLPWAGHVVTWDPTSAEHLAERYRQFFIVALGELILTSGLTFNAGGFGFGSGRTAAFVVSVVTTALLWRIYIFRAGEVLPAAFKVASTPARLGIAPVYVHLAMVAGIVVTAVGDQLFIARPFGRTPLAWAIVILGGPVLFLAGRASFEYVIFAQVSWDRPIGALVLAILILPALHVPPLLAAIAATVVLLGIAITDAVRVQRHPGGPVPPRVGKTS